MIGKMCTQETGRHVNNRVQGLAVDLDLYGDTIGIPGALDRSTVVL